MTIPSTAAAPALSFWLRTDTAETGSHGVRHDEGAGGQRDDDHHAGDVLQRGANATYAQKSFSLSSYKGKTVTVKFLMNEDSSLQTSFVVDDTSVTTG